jgi:ATP-dependent DNA ligase
MILREGALPNPAASIELCSPAGPGWIHEIKHDGYRILARRDG